MANMTCDLPGKYVGNNGRCCDTCSSGTFKKADCEDTRTTVCESCPKGTYTATTNHLPHCRSCTVCIGAQLKIEQTCTSQKDTVCGCIPGYFCFNESCDVCMKIDVCAPGYGVKVRANRTSNTVCEQCQNGTFSNVTDYHSACLPHTRCEYFGGVTKIAGTATTDAHCGPSITECSWILPASLWSGLALTFIVFILFAVFCFWRKCRSYNTAHPGVNLALIEAQAARPMLLPFPSMEVKHFCHESCTLDGCSLPLYIQAGNGVSVDTQESKDICEPTTPFKASVSFVETSYENGTATNCSADFQRMPSEPQEDEWCGT